VQLFVCAQNFDGRKINPKSSIIAFDSKSDNIYDVIKNAPPYSTVYFNKNEELVIKKPIVIDKPLTLVGLNAMLPEGLGKTSIVEVNSKDVSIFDFKLKGNTASVEQIERAPLIRIYKSNFHIERCLFKDSSKDGVEISPLANSEDIDGGVVRNIVGRNCVRDVISINGSHGEKNMYIRNILVEDIRGYDSSLRGPVEVSDGSENITVRKIYAENCIYAVDWQDHNRPAEINKNTLIDDVYALNCKYAIRNAVHDFGHTNLTLTNIIAEKCQEPLKIANTSNVIIQNVRIIDHQGEKNPFTAKNCNGLTIQNLSILNSTSDKEGVLIENCDEVLIDGISFSGEVKKLSCGISYHIAKKRRFKNLRISNVSAVTLHKEGIILSNDKNATLDSYIISGNISKVKDLINGDNKHIENNL
jgi:hypothetical protein